MQQNVFYREETSIVNCPRCARAMLLRYAVDAAATNQRAADMKARGENFTPDLRIYHTNPYLLLCSVCPFNHVLARTRRRKLIPSSAPQSVNA